MVPVCVRVCIYIYIFLFGVIAGFAFLNNVKFLDKFQALVTFFLTFQAGPEQDAKEML